MYVCCPWLLRRRHLSQCRFNVVGVHGILNGNRIFSKRSIEYVAAKNEFRSAFFHFISLHNLDNTLFIFMFIINSNFSLSLLLLLLLLLLLWLEVYAYIDYCFGARFIVAYRTVLAWVLWKLLLHFTSIQFNSACYQNSSNAIHCIFYLSFINKKITRTKNHEYNNNAHNPHYYVFI